MYICIIGGLCLGVGGGSGLIVFVSTSEEREREGGWGGVWLVGALHYLSMPCLNCVLDFFSSLLFGRQSRALRPSLTPVSLLYAHR